MNRKKILIWTVWRAFLRPVVSPNQTRSFSINKDFQHVQSVFYFSIAQKIPQNMILDITGNTIKHQESPHTMLICVLFGLDVKCLLTKWLSVTYKNLFFYFYKRMSFLRHRSACWVIKTLLVKQAKWTWFCIQNAGSVLITLITLLLSKL